MATASGAQSYTAMDGQDHAAMIDDDQVAESVEFLTTGVEEQGGRVQRSEDTLLHLENLELVADNGGWDRDRLELLLASVRTVSWPAQLARKLLNCLVPRGLVSGRALASLCLWALGTRGLSADCVLLPSLRLTSLCLQYDCVEDRRPLQALYELFLGRLGQAKLTACLAELLSLLTSKPDVSRWRVAAVLAVQAAALGSQPALAGLVCKLRQVRPDLVPQYTAPRALRPARQGGSGTALHRRFHKVWADRVDNNMQAGGIWSQRQALGYKKARRDCLVPGGAVLAVTSGLQSQQRDGAIALSECSSLGQVTDNLHRLQLPAQILSLLGCRVGVNVLATDRGLVERLSLTLYYTLHNEFISCGEVGRTEAAAGRRRARRDHILRLLVQLQRAVQQGLPVIGRFLSEYLAVWDGQEHLNSVIALISQVQITDFRELYDCLLERQQAHFTHYSSEQRLLVVRGLGDLLRSWATVEHAKFNTVGQGEEQGLFPINSQHCANSLQSVLDLGRHIGELVTYSLAQAVEQQEETDLLVSKVFDMYKLNQKALMAHKVPVRLEVPKHYFYAAVFSYNAALIDQACGYILLNKEVIISLRAHGKRHLEDTETSEIIYSQLTAGNMTALNDVTRDLLVLLAPGRTEVTAASVLRVRPWALGREAWLRDQLFISSHPAFLPHALRYLGSQGVRPADMPAAWQRLKEEDAGGADGGVNCTKFLEQALADHPAIEDFVKTFSQHGRATAAAAEQETNSVCSRSTARTADSGWESSLPRARRRSGRQAEAEAKAGEAKERSPPKKSKEAAGPSRGGQMVDRALRERNRN